MRSQKEANDMADFMIRFLVCNVFLSGIIGILLLIKRLLKHTLSSRLQYHLWFFLLGLCAVPFLPLRLNGLPQLLSRIGRPKTSPAARQPSAPPEQPFPETRTG